MRQAGLRLFDSRRTAPDACICRFDLVSAGLSLAAVLPVTYAVKELAVDGVSWENGLVLSGGLLLVREGFAPRTPQLPQDQAERG